MLKEKYFYVNFWKGISFYYILALFSLNPGNSYCFILQYQGITGISMFVTPYITNQHAAIWDLQLFRRNCEPLHFTLNIVERGIEEFNSIRDLIPLQSHVRREDTG